jgi:hypothetical protein
MDQNPGTVQISMSVAAALVDVAIPHRKKSAVGVASTD